MQVGIAFAPGPHLFSYRMGFPRWSTQARPTLAHYRSPQLQGSTSLKPSRLVYACSLGQSCTNTSDDPRAVTHDLEAIHQHSGSPRHADPPSIPQIGFHSTTAIRHACSRRFLIFDTLLQFLSRPTRISRLVPRLNGNSDLLRFLPPAPRGVDNHTAWVVKAFSKAYIIGAGADNQQRWALAAQSHDTYRPEALRAHPTPRLPG
ncbi:hypothetical protein B0T21DRAFT_13894 [Apiosordaria backusii]|uniref:Uncharacterized protein n=1 Tax=Apiosordaria backusii TaxID=314023 RepID=A0AA40EYW1_9PEZI|nr:hypothetical protein B0T21DRAFT_13894 [Apiosordaria backusii]